MAEYLPEILDYENFPRPLTFDQFLLEHFLLERQYKTLYRSLARANGDLTGLELDAKLMLKRVDNALQQIALKDGKIRLP